MAEVSSIFGVVSKRVPWDKGKIVGAKPPLGPKPSIRTRLQVEGWIRDFVCSTSPSTASSVVAMSCHSRSMTSRSGIMVDRMIEIVLERCSKRQVSGFDLLT
jgi:hypothetical protein